MNRTESWSGGTEEEYETQHFGFGAQRFKIAVRQMVKDKIREGVKEMESFLQEELDLNNTDKADLTQSCEDEIQRQQVSEEEYNKLKEEVALLR
ncbi:unnamed protein product [Parnassius apollo]|uniref:(apollo) hypothetical protein n=1 Tax=Parnassius apollo TaxID=110799 RepID=A0A8S3WVC1_PARAO|nr:unnamed protein product [Parnassius apollo]